MAAEPMAKEPHPWTHPVSTAHTSMGHIKGATQTGYVHADSSSVFLLGGSQPSLFPLPCSEKSDLRLSCPSQSALRSPHTQLCKLTDPTAQQTLCKHGWLLSSHLSRPAQTLLPWSSATARASTTALKAANQGLLKDPAFGSFLQQ